jgi:hypothetical protein
MCTSLGQDALLTGVPPAVVDVLQLTCPGLVVIVSVKTHDRIETIE